MFIELLTWKSLSKVRDFQYLINFKQCVFIILSIKFSNDFTNSNAMLLLLLLRTSTRNYVFKKKFFCSFQRLFDLYKEVLTHSQMQIQANVT